jgi:thiosulfate reductase cytochrome b subunit
VSLLLVILSQRKHFPRIAKRPLSNNNPHFRGKLEILEDNTKPFLSLDNIVHYHNYAAFLLTNNLDFGIFFYC